MSTIFSIIQIVSAILLGFLILVHSAKGEGLGSIGSSAQMFQTTSTVEKGLNILTAIIAFLFTFSSAIIGWGLIK